MGQVIKFERSLRHKFRLLRAGLAIATGLGLAVVLFGIQSFSFQESVSTPQAQNISGRASVIDGDTIEIHGTRIRLFGIDAPEGSQICTVQGKPFRCGQQAALALADHIANQVVNCQPKDRDRYGRVVAVCRVKGRDINGWLVAQGWALAYRQYSSDYVSQEQSASKAKIGMWQGEFIAPWEWRWGQRQ